MKIFGVYTHAELDRGLGWVAVGRELGKKGTEYKRRSETGFQPVYTDLTTTRCVFRKRPHNAGDNVFMPESFPPLEEEQPPASEAPDLPADDVEQVRPVKLLMALKD